MVTLDASALAKRELNKKIKSCMASGEAEILVEHPGSVHNLGTALKGEATITVDGSTGFYTGGFLEGPRLVIKGNTGWYTGDNMLCGEIIVEKNAGSNCAPSTIGGTIVVRGNTGGRAGLGMKGGDLVICGSTGRWCGQMTMGGRIVVLGEVGQGLGESMYRGLIHVRDPQAEEKLGGNVEFHPISEQEAESLNMLFEKYAIDADASEFMSLRPMTSGRHHYTLFNPKIEKAEA
ncbi:glutamate synthase [Oceanidesulfovibrio marinus]|uniref:Glutamate synthase n=1 Tax=Oceanidesulfovibrio marinus TaxID=370038 RepID=A0ABX6NDK9_9BACT|nr:glutamate synthase [Oceanidesulfovibrio marinus]QJT08689.1 glutamate synthase [Oceanidesulfovibrio marinus]